MRPTANDTEGGCVLKERSDEEPAAALPLVKNARDKPNVSLLCAALRLVCDTAAFLPMSAVHLRIET